MQPTITITDAAATAFQSAVGKGDAIHLSVSETYEHNLDIGPVSGDAEPLHVNGIAIEVEPESAPRANGIHIDFIEGATGAGFRIENPNAPPKITEIDCGELESRLASSEIEVLVDVRTTWEREIASLSPSLLLDESSGPKLQALDKDTPIAFYCHHGVRSRSAASHFVQLGFTKVYNLIGGIDAWSQTVDSSVPRY